MERSMVCIHTEKVYPLDEQAALRRAGEYNLEKLLCEQAACSREPGMGGLGLDNVVTGVFH